MLHRRWLIDDSVSLLNSKGARGKRVLICAGARVLAVLFTGDGTSRKGVIMKKFEGVFPAVITPFTHHGLAVDEEKYSAVVQHLIHKKVHGLFIAGTTGEGPSLCVEERKRLIDLTMKHTAGHTAVIAHCSFNDPHDAIAVGLHAQSAGVDGIALLTPWYYKCDQQAIYRHIQTIVESVTEIPVFLYNIPQRTTNPFEFETVRTLKETYPTIAGIKESGDFANLDGWLKLQDERFTVFNGKDDLEFEAYQKGVRAVVAAFGNIMPDAFTAFHAAASQGDWDGALAHQERIRATIGAVENENLIANIKAVLRFQGVDAGSMRFPLRDLDAREETELIAQFRQCGL
jgi:4-hydroxy-tetrahydrodipicolinate synthase